MTIRALNVVISGALLRPREVEIKTQEDMLRARSNGEQPPSCNPYRPPHRTLGVALTTWVPMVQLVHSRQARANPAGAGRRLPRSLWRRFVQHDCCWR